MEIYVTQGDYYEIGRQDPKRRLSDTIKCLNRKQANSLIHFRGDGTGEGIVWEFAAPEYQVNNAE